jgi:hypothetical protein
MTVRANGRRAAHDLSPPRYLWHYRLHERIANERLAFILMGFDPHYHREHTKGDVKRSLTRLGIRSYAIWELIGEHDLLLQAWLPSQVDTPTLQEAITDELPRVNVDMLSMTVDKFLHHWMWERDLDFVAASELVDSRHYHDLNGPPEPGIPLSAIRSYQAANLITRVPPYNTVKFFLRITNPKRATNEENHRQLETQAKAALDHPRIKSPVLMRVRGDGGSYLLTGRVRPIDLEQITVAVGETLGQANLLDYLRCRTTTHISALHSPIDRREQLLPEVGDSPVRGAPTPERVRSWLLQAEGDNLEFKSSAFTDVDHAVGKKDVARTRDEQARDVAKAVCGLLNATGGHVVVGVAELDRFTEEQLVRAFDRPLVEGARAVIGVDHEFPDKSGWDAYQRLLAAKLSKALSKGAQAWLTFHQVLVDHHTVCVIEVGRPSRWYYLQEEKGQTFFGRSGGQTIPFAGQDIDEFKDAHPRTSRGVNG